MSNDNHNPRNPGYPQGNPDIVEAGRATRFASGRSGNPSGRPSTRVLTEELRKSLASQIPAELARELGLPSDSTFAGAIAARLIRLAANGQIPAIREVYERTEGKPPKEVVSDEPKKVKIDLVYGTPLQDLAYRLANLVSTTDDEKIKELATSLEILIRQEIKERNAEKSSGQIGG